VDAIITNVLRLMAGALSLAVLVGLFLAARIVRPIQHLRSAASGMAGGDLSVRANILRHDEIGDLGAAFDLMATQLERDITERKRAEKALAHQALHDALTGLPNRILLGDRLEQAILTAEREQRELALLVMDLDRFKEVNDTLGHHAGDRLLQEIGRRLRGAVRASDTVARLGGDEFAVVLPGSTDAAGAAVKLTQALEVPFELEGHTLALGASVGVAQYPQHGETVESLLRSADVAMYTAKRARTGVAVYAPDQDQHSVDRLGLLADLREALTREDELLLYYQPKWDLHSGALAGFEALARWQHPRRGLLQPDEFVNLAEQSGLMRALTRYALQAALRQVRAWQEIGLHMPVAVNLSPSSLQDIQLATEIDQLLAEAGVAPEWLEVEITEEAYMSQPEVAAATLARLRDMGVRVAIDDFGTGYASLVYLQKLPVDRIKIDRSFVRALLRDESQATIVRSLIDLGHNLGLEVVAEGVEDDATQAGLAALGCDYAQGYALGAPKPAPDITRELLDAQPRRRAA
jgi:diguanylate cyclase (GGDEF)-like protein